MYKKSADLIHLHQRTASHSTKGGGRGTPWFEPLTDEEREIIEVRRACQIAREQFEKIRVARKRAKEAGNKKLAREYSEAMRLLIKGVNKAKAKGIDVNTIHWY